MAKSDLYHKIMIEDVLAELEKLSCEKPEEVKLKPGATLEEISEFEATTGKPLPSDYKAFLQKTNGAEISTLEFHCLAKIEHTPFRYLGENDGEVKAPYTYALVQTGECQILINLKAPSGAKNPNRYDIIDRYSGGDDTCRVIAKTFGEFLYRVLKEVEIQKEEENVDYWLKESFEEYRELGEVGFD